MAPHALSPLRRSVRLIAPAEPHEIGVRQVAPLVWRRRRPPRGRRSPGHPALTASLPGRIEADPDAAQSLMDQANVNLAAGAPFISKAEVEALMTDAGVSAEVTHEFVAQNEVPQIDGLRTALSVLAVMGAVSLFISGRLPTKQPGSERAAT